MTDKESTALPEDESEDVSLGFEDDDKKLEPVVKFPRWLQILLMFIPAGIIVGIIMAVDLTVGFPETIFPTAIIAISGLGLFGLVVIGDMVYRNIYVYRMLRFESKKSRVYKQILKEKKEEQAQKERHEFTQDSEYEYDDDEEEELVEEDDLEEYEEQEESEYKYDVEEDTFQKRHRMKSYILRGGILTILIVNAIVLLVIAAILQYTYYGGFTVAE